eukprot:2852929-Heterocapsa_arctica.AAC.1
MEDRDRGGARGTEQELLGAGNGRQAPITIKVGTRGERGWEGAPVCTRVTLDFLFRGIGRKSQLYTILPYNTY